MKSLSPICALVFAAMPLTVTIQAADAPPIPRFSTDYMDKSVEPAADFYHYAAGTWIKKNPVPADKSRWASFSELQERNWHLIHEILDGTTNAAVREDSPAQKVRDFYISALDTNRIEKLGFKPLGADLKRIDKVRSKQDLFALVADFHMRGVGGFFADGVSPDAKNSSVYAFQLSQGGLGLPDRDYYLKDSFAKQREAYTNHIARMFVLAGTKRAEVEAAARTVLDLETQLAKASKARADLRDPIANYHKFGAIEAGSKYPDLSLRVFFTDSGLGQMPDLIIRQPEFLEDLDRLVKERPLSEWKIYLRWHLIHSAAPYLHAAVEAENFDFYGKVLREQQVQEPRWQRAARVIDAEIGEALGQLFVEKYFPPAARARMIELVENLKAVFKDRLQKLEWMSEATRAKALVKFDRFTQKIGHPDKFRDYSLVDVRPDDYLGNVRRAELFEARRQYGRVGKPVDRTEWHMTPETVNAYFNPSMNEIVFPAGILQPPFFDPDADDASNYGGMGAVIGHEMTHGFDDEGRKFDAQGNLRDWWTPEDEKNFNERAQCVKKQLESYKVQGDLHENGDLVLGESIADLGGLNIAYRALEKELGDNRPPSIGGFTTEQRFFLAYTQIWAATDRPEFERLMLNTNPHPLGRLRAIAAPSNMQAFSQAFGCKEGDALVRPAAIRCQIW